MGSLGAENMNEVMCRFIELAGKKPGFTLVHSAGIEGYEKMVEHLRRTVPNYEKNGMDVREYIYDMPRVMVGRSCFVPRRSFNHIRAYIYA